MEAIVGFFDILGYTSFLEANQTEDVARSVLDVINAMPERVKAEVGLVFQGQDHTARQTGFLVFSDTILMTLDLTGASTSLRRRLWQRFIVESVLLSRHLLINGLPVRGAITNGSILVQKYCFAGMPIVEAYRLCNNLNLAATVIARPSFSTAKQLDDSFGMSFSRFFVEEYAPPLKAAMNEAPVLLWPTLSTSPFYGTAEDVARRAFTAWGKRLNANASDKLANTIKYFDSFTGVFARSAQYGQR